MWAEWEGRFVVFIGGHCRGYHSRSLPDLSLAWDYHNLMLIVIVTTMNTDVEEREGQDFYFQVNCSLRQRDSTSANRRRAVHPNTQMTNDLQDWFHVLLSAESKRKTRSGVVFSCFFLDIHRTYPSAGQSKQRAANLLHSGKHILKSCHVSTWDKDEKDATCSTPSILLSSGQEIV